MMCRVGITCGGKVKVYVCMCARTDMDDAYDFMNLLHNIRILLVA